MASYDSDSEFNDVFQESYFDVLDEDRIYWFELHTVNHYSKKIHDIYDLNFDSNSEYGMTRNHTKILSMANRKHIRNGSRTSHVYTMRCGLQHRLNLDYVEKQQKQS